MDLDQEMLRSLGLWHRELYYLEQVVERPLPSLVKGGVPDGFVQVSRHRISSSDASEGKSRFQAALISYAWNEPYDPSAFTEDQLFRAIREGCSPYGINHFGRLQIVRRMLRLSRRQMWQWVFIRANESCFGRIRPQFGKRVWVHEDMLASLTQHVDFVKPL